MLAARRAPRRLPRRRPVAVITMTIGTLGPPRSRRRPPRPAAPGWPWPGRACSRWPQGYAVEDSGSL